MSRSSIFIVALLAQGCFNAAGCIPLPKIPDAGFDASFANDLLYNQVVGDPAPILDGGSTVFGSLVFTTTFDGGDRIETVTIGPGGPKLHTVVFVDGDDHHVVGTADVNLDGVIDYQYTSTFDGLSTFQTTIVSDTDFDGIYDTHDLWVVDVDGGRPFNKTETVSRFVFAVADGGAADGGDAGTWVQQWSYTGPAVAQGLSYVTSAALQYSTACNGQDGFPSGITGASLLNVPNTRISIVTGSQAGACSTERANALLAAFKQSITDMASCLTGANPLTGRQLKAAISTRVLFVGCGVACDGVAASTDLPYASDSQSDEANARVTGGGFQHMNIHPYFIDNFGTTQIEEYVGHELLHFAGIDHNPPGAGDPVGHDLVYGCGRYCTRCKSGSVTAGWSGTVTPEMWAYDCADCTDPFRVKQCGDIAYVEPDCSTSACSKLPTGNGCGSAAVCCRQTVYNCFNDGAADPAGRSLYVFGAESGLGACIQSGDNPQCKNDPLCAPDTNLNKGKGDDCYSYPVGWCTGK